MAEVIVAIIAGVLTSLLAAVVASDISGAVSSWLVRRAIQISPPKIRKVLADEWIADYEAASTSSPARSLLRAASYFVYASWARFRSLINVVAASEATYLWRTRAVVTAVLFLVPLVVLSIVTKDAEAWASFAVAASSLVGTFVTLILKPRSAKDASDELERATAEDKL